MTETQEKKVYRPPALTVVSFRTERGYASSRDGLLELLFEGRSSGGDAWGSSGGMHEGRTGDNDAWGSSGSTFETRLSGENAW